MRNFLLYIILVVIGLGCGKEKGPVGEARLISYSYSDTCLAKNPPQDTAEVEIIIDGLKITVVHKNAMFNCCPDSIIVEFTQENTLLKLFEKEVLGPEACDCTCPFEVSAIIEVPRNGTYILEIYTEGHLVYRKEISV